MFTKLRNLIVSFLKLFSKNKNIGTYTIFFFISLAFWFFTMLSKVHETNFVVPIKYINYPVDLIPLSNPDAFIKVRVKAAGISIILFYLFNRSYLVLDYDVVNSQPTNKGKNLFWIMNSKRQELTNIFGNSVDIIDIKPDRLLMSFENENKKEVPVELNSDINYRPSYWLDGDLKISPLSVAIYGKQSILDSITSVQTKLLKLNDVYKDQQHKVDILLPKGVKCKNTSVFIDIGVEPFIEEFILEEVQVRNLKDGYSIKLFPREVGVTLRLSKDQHRVMKTGFIQLYVDASNILDKNILVIEYDILPQMVRVERIYPNSLEFLLIKE